MNYYSISALASDSEGNIFASNSDSTSSLGKRISVSTNNGDSWFDISSGLPGSPASLAVERKGTIYGATYDGVFRLDSLDLTSLMVQTQIPLNRANILSQNSPNPFTQTTTISFTLPEPSYITLTLYDAAGREVAALMNGFMDAGEHDVPFQRGNTPGGVYFYRLESGGQSQTRAMVIF